MVEVKRSVLVDHPAEVMFDLIEAAEHYPAFVPGCSAAEIVERSDEVVAAKLTMKLAGIALVIHTRNPKRRPTWMLIEMQPGSGSAMRRFRGEWRLTPLNAAGCRIDFTLAYELDGAVAKIAQAAFSRVADQLVDAFVQRADRVLPRVAAPTAPARPTPSGPQTMPSAPANVNELLRSTKLAAELTAPQTQLLAGVMELRDLKEGEVLVHEGSADEHLYLLVSGVLGVVKNAASAEERVTLNTLAAGDFAGELSWLDGAQRYASLVAMAPTRVLGLARVDLESLIERDPLLVYRVMRAIVRAVHQIQYRLSMQQSELANYIYKQHGKY